MNFPKVIKQHKNESLSFAIILYKLRKIGIFRNMTESDYGIDFEIEVVNKDRVEGRCIKVQVKSSDNLKINKNGHATVGNIKQSSLYYWAELSYSTPVVAIAVDIKNEKIYVSKPLFWQAISLLDDKNSAKKIELNDSQKKSTSKKKTKTIDFGREKKAEEYIDRLKFYAYNYDLRGLIFAHKWLLHNWGLLMSIAQEIDDYDKGCMNVDITLFHSFLDNAKLIFTSYELSQKVCNNLFSTQLAKKKCHYDELTNEVVIYMFRKIFPLLLIFLEDLNTKVCNSAYYWIEKDPRYLKLVIETEIPQCTSYEEILKCHCSMYKRYEENVGISKELLGSIIKLEKKLKLSENTLFNALISC